MNKIILEHSIVPGKKEILENKTNPDRESGMSKGPSRKRKSS
jgi:hypothetical protein